MVDHSEHKKAKGTKKYVIKGRLMVKNYKDCLFNNKLILKSLQRFKIDHHNVYNRILWIWKNKWIIKFNKQPVR